MFFEILKLCNQVRDLNEYEVDGKYIYRPKILVLDEFKRVVIRAYTYIGKAPISPKIESDKKGGLITKWTMPIGTYIKYHIPAEGDTTLQYCFTEIGDTVRCPTHDTLVKYLNRLK